MSRVFHRNPRHKYPVAVGSDGPYQIDRGGKRYLDACGGTAISSLGHSARELIGAINAQRYAIMDMVARSIDGVIVAEYIVIAPVS